MAELGYVFVERAACSFRMLIKFCKQAGSMFYYDPPN